MTKTERISRLTGLDDPTDLDSLLEWVRTQGYDGDSLDKAEIDEQARNNPDVTPLCKQVLAEFIGVVQ